MTRYDVVMICLVLGGMIWGAIRGITWQLASIASLVLAYLFSHQVSGYVAPYIPGEPIVNRAGSMLAAYLLMSAGVFFLAWTVRATLKAIRFEAYDRHLGMLLGGVEGALLGLVGTLFVVSLAPPTREPIFNSFSGRVVAQVMDKAGPVLPPEVRQIVTPFWAHVMEIEPSATIALPTQPLEQPSEGSSLQDLARGARSKVGKAVGDAVRSEVERLGEQDYERNSKRR